MANKCSGLRGLVWSTRGVRESLYIYISSRIKVTQSSKRNTVQKCDLLGPWDLNVGVKPTTELYA